MSESPLLVMAAGGTGGHMFPAQALAEVMLQRGWRVTLSTDARGARYTGIFPDAVSVEVLPSATFSRGGLRAKAGAPFRILSGIGRAMMKMRQDRPRVVVGFGGYPSIPALSAAWLTRTPRMIHEQNGVLGRVNRVFASRVDLVACGVWPTKMPQGAKGRHVGNPVRASVLAHRASPYPQGSNPVVLVLGGSQGARVLSDHVPAGFAALPSDLRSRVHVYHQARIEDHDRVVASYQRAGVTATVAAFFENVPDLMAQSALVISRAGASSVAEISVIGRPSILIPFAAALDDHQTANAKALVDAHAAIAIPEREISADRLAEEITEILQDPAKGQSMADAALSCGRPEAARDLADLVQTVAGRNVK